MAALSEATWEKVRALFPPTKHEEVAALLQNQCGNNLPFLGTETPEGLERFRFAVLKLSQGRMDKLRDAVKLANTDWRDLLVAAGFADSADSHKHWNLA
ncbi:MAG TPA: hypothetical protein VGS27_16720 [Candidatus Sulfotelmatobacter sp.]|nr:hypothetical protein [Candidatus Sulfotelmatobacter sp.]HEV2470023.1 hypothetical protein [Candidatus Sulfotelmatobacter sp.]